GFSRFELEKTSLRLQYAGGHDKALVQSEEEHDRLHEIPPHYSVDVTAALTEPTNIVLRSTAYNRPVLKWNHIVYESAVSETDVVLFAKGINTREGINAAPQTLRCVFSNIVETAVTVSA
ncbi:hypothetical protein KI387_042960, partial [Taxus chinensis]